MYLSTNIKLLRKRRDLSQEDLANAIGVKRTSITGYEKGTSSPPLIILVALSDFLKISIDNLLKEDLESYSELKLRALEQKELDLKGSNLRVLATTVGDDNEENIELVHKKAKAGYTEGLSDPEFIQVLPTFRMPFLKNDRKYRTFQISGDSMPPVDDGSWVTGEFVQNWDTISNGMPYIIVTKDEGIVFKVVYNKLKERKTLMLCSTNTFYQPYEVKAEDILEVWAFTHYISSEMPVNRYKSK